MVKKNKKRFIALLLSLAVACPHTALGEIRGKAASGDFIQKVSSDKASYQPGTKAWIYVDLKNPSSADSQTGKLVVTFTHLEERVGEPVRKRVSLSAGESKTVAIAWRTPDQDYQGYYAEVQYRSRKGEVLDRETIGLDVSSTWTRFPRYGFLTDFGAEASVDGNVGNLKDYHINALQFYDWQYKHHQPIKLNSDGTIADSWQDLVGATTSVAKLKEYISKLHGYNMAAMPYNLIYGAYDGYESDGVSPQWGIYNDTAHSSQANHDLSDAGFVTKHLWLFNPANQGWRDYYYGKQKQVYEYLDFDGFHGDTLGDLGTKYDYNGDPVNILDTYQDFLNQMKAAMPDKYLVLNTVGAKGHQQVNVSNADVLYSELWEWDGFQDLNSIKDIIDVSRKESGGKSLVVPAYMNYAYGKEKAGYHTAAFNNPSVKLMDAVVYAAGGSRLELGDSDNMLSNEYFPFKPLYMDDQLKEWEKTLYDFIVAYENILRDGQENTNNRFRIRNYDTSVDGQNNTVWTFSKKDENYDVIHMINLLGTKEECGWRDTNAQQVEPTRAENLKMRYYYNGAIDSLWLASPDYNKGLSRKLTYRRGKDAHGNYIDFTVPSLEYWDMIYMKKKSASDTDNDTVAPYAKGELVNGGFENGFLNGWKATGTNVFLDGADVAGGKYKCYFYKEEGFTQKLEQTVQNLAGGTYKVSASVKQSIGTPLLCRMEATDSAGNTTYTDIGHGSRYSAITSEVVIPDGSITIAFYMAAGQAANLQIDNVKLQRVGETPRIYYFQGEDNVGANGVTGETGAGIQYVYSETGDGVLMSIPMSDVAEGTYSVKLHYSHRGSSTYAQLQCGSYNKWCQFPGTSQTAFDVFGSAAFHDDNGDPFKIYITKDDTLTIRRGGTESGHWIWIDYIELIPQ